MLTRVYLFFWYKIKRLFLYGVSCFYRLFPRKRNLALEEKRFPLNGAGNFIDVWRFVQTQPWKVFRWLKYWKEVYLIRKQNGLQHAMALILIVKKMRFELQQLLPGFAIDWHLVEDCAFYHDWGEALDLKVGDKIAWEKSDHDDVDEYNRFVAYVERKYDNELEIYQLKRIFLLQFVLDNETMGINPGVSNFPKEAQNILLDLFQTKKYEAMLFKLSENWDYFLYPIDEYRRTGYAKSLVSVGSYNPQIVREIGKHIPQVFIIFWTPEMECQTEVFLAENTDAQKNLRRWEH
jgi:hypothetical protein